MSVWLLVTTNTPPCEHKIQGTLWKRWHKDCNSQRTRISAVTLYFLEMIDESHPFYNSKIVLLVYILTETWRSTLSDRQSCKEEISRGPTHRQRTTGNEQMLIEHFPFPVTSHLPYYPILSAQPCNNLHTGDCKQTSRLYLYI